MRFGVLEAYRLFLKFESFVVKTNKDCVGAYYVFDEIFTKNAKKNYDGVIIIYKYVGEIDTQITWVAEKKNIFDLDETTQYI